jgi:hypothetical protein
MATSAAFVPSVTARGRCAPATRKVRTTPGPGVHIYGFHGVDTLLLQAVVAKAFELAPPPYPLNALEPHMSEVRVC